MDVVFGGRHCEVTDRFRRHVDDKLARLPRWAGRVDRIELEVSKEKNPRLAGRSERVELTVYAQDCVVRAEAAAEDRYVALDLAMDKLHARLRRMADRRRVHRGAHRPMSVAEAMATSNSHGVPATAVLTADRPATEPSHPAGTLVDGHGEAVEPTVPDAATADLEVVGDGPLVVRQKTHRAAPMSLDEALSRMELLGHDFYLFVDAGCGLPSVAYRRRGYDYGVIRLESTA